MPGAQRPRGVELISNVCRHRQAVMLKGKARCKRSKRAARAATSPVPLHRWTYSPGRRIAGRAALCARPRLNLNNYKLREWNGLLFEDNGYDVAADLAQMGPKADLSFDGYVLDHVELHECNYNWKTFIEVYLEDYHVGPFHPAWAALVTCDDLRWEFGKNYSVQTVAWPTVGKAAAPCTNAGMKPCWRTVTACHQSTEPSGSRCTRTSWWSGIRTCSRSRRCTPSARPRR